MENSLFKKEIIYEYINHPSTKDNTLSQKLRNKKIYTFDEIEPILYSTGHFTRNSDDNRSLNIIGLENKYAFLKSLYDNVCQKKIGKRYLEYSVESASFDANSDFELAVLFDNQFEGSTLSKTLDNTESSYNENTFVSDYSDEQSQSQKESQSQQNDIYSILGKRTILDTKYNSEDDTDDMTFRPRDRWFPTNNNIEIDNAVAFIVTQKGECKKLPSVYSVNLICARPGERGAGSGQILLGLFLYCLSEISDATKKGILELADGYVNISGLASYSKLGFQVNYDLYGNDCFNDYNNLPMIADNIVSQNIIDILVDGANIYSKPLLCNFSKTPELQKFLAFCKNLVIFNNIVPENQRYQYITDRNDYKYLEFNNEFYKLGIGGEKLEELIDDIESGKLVIDYPNFNNIFERFKNETMVGGKNKNMIKTRKMKENRKTRKIKKASKKNKKSKPSKKCKLRKSKRCKKYIT